MWWGQNLSKTSKRLLRGPKFQEVFQRFLFFAWFCHSKNSGYCLLPRFFTPKQKSFLPRQNTVEIILGIRQIPELFDFKVVGTQRVLVWEYPRWILVKKRVSPVFSPLGFPQEFLTRTLRYLILRSRTLNSGFWPSSENCKNNLRKKMKPELFGIACRDVSFWFGRLWKILDESKGFACFFTRIFSCRPPKNSTSLPASPKTLDFSEVLDRKHLLITPCTICLA